MNTTNFCTALEQTISMVDVSGLLAEFGGQYGMGTHAISPIPTPEHPVGELGFLVQNWPAEWGEIYDEEGFGEFDPVPRASAMLATPMTITDIRAGKAGFDPDPRSDRIFELGAEMGRSHGFMVPIFGPNSYRAIVCFAGTGPDPDAAAQRDLRVAGIFAHDHIRALVSERVDVMGKLTAREIRALACAGRGMTDAATAAELGIPPRTVRFHLYNAREKLNTPSQAEAIEKASAMGLI